MDTPIFNKTVLEEIEEQAVPEFTFKSQDIGEVVSSLVPYIYYFAGVLLLVYLILGGFQLMFSGGDPKKTQAGQSKITNALIGFAIVFLAYWITQILGKMLGISFKGPYPG